MRAKEGEWTRRRQSRRGGEVCREWNVTQKELLESTLSGGLTAIMTTLNMEKPSLIRSEFTAWRHT